MRIVFTTTEFYERGGSRSELRTGLKNGLWVAAGHGAYANGPEEPDPLTRAAARIKASGDVATGLVGAALYELDAIEPATLLVPRRRRAVAFGGEANHVQGILVASGLQIIVELAAILDDLRWEQALESGLRKGLFSIDELERLLPELSASRTHGAPRIRRVLRLRPAGAPPTESLMETLMVQIARHTPGVPEPERQVKVYDPHGGFVARVDLGWQDLGAFTELDGMQHKGQPEYDASRESAVVAATGWLCGRFVWREVRYNPKSTSRRLAAILDRARERPLRPDKNRRFAPPSGGK
ncbi:MAG TPA: DUF559 domain-containing protein [Acidimicrobiales bacterium]|nr:DUF559 domain-containing protein [Acidimicrobiales bacterium]